MIDDLEQGNAAPLIQKSKVSQEGQIEQSEKFTCGICYEEYNQGEVQLKMLEKCHHTFCADCFEQTFKACIEDQSKSHLLKCP